MERKRITLLVTVDLDPVPGEFNTRESWKRQAQQMFTSAFGWYHPHVEVGHATLSLGATRVLRERLLALEGYTEVIADAVVDNYPIEIAEANGWTDLFSYKPMSEEAIKEADNPQYV